MSKKKLKKKKSLSRSLKNLRKKLSKFTIPIRKY